MLFSTVTKIWEALKPAREEMHAESSVQREFQKTMSDVVADLVNVIVEQITSDLKLDDSLTLSGFFRLCDIEVGSPKYNLFMSGYRDQIVNRAEKSLYHLGYDCEINVIEGVSGRPLKISYKTKIRDDYFKSLCLITGLVLGSTSVLLWGGFLSGLD